MSSPVPSEPLDGPVPCRRHSGVQTRLSCSTCGTPVCPQCMVACPVGFKCPDCVRQTISHVGQVTLVQRLLLVVPGIGVGVIYGYVRDYLLGVGMFRFFGIPFLGLLLCYLTGTLAGRGIQRLVHYKYGILAMVLVTVGILVGLYASPFEGVLLVFLDLLNVYDTIDIVSGERQSLLAFAVMEEFVGAYLFTVGVQSRFRAGGK